LACLGFLLLALSLLLAQLLCLLLRLLFSKNLHKRVRKAM
jgi:hypothetical protein